MQTLKFAVAGCGFWANYQISAWKELHGVELIALYNRTLSKAKVLAEKFNVKNVYDSVDAMLDNHAHELDFVDIISQVNAHAELTEKIAAKGINIICQKPMARTFEEAKAMMKAVHGVKFFIHENFRWQTPMRRLKQAIDSGVIGRPFKARISFCTAFKDIYVNQPLLTEMQQLIIADNGSHQLDLARFLFGEVEFLFCTCQRIKPDLAGEDVANIQLRTLNGVDCYIELSFHSLYEKEIFPQTLIVVEGDKGSVCLANDYNIRITTPRGTSSERVYPKKYSWADPDYAVVHSSIVDCNQDILNDLKGIQTAETTGADNFETVKLVFASYESDKTRQVIYPKQFL